MKLTNNISLQEVVPQVIYNKYGTMSVRLMSGQIIEGTQFVIDYMGWDYVIMNTWNNGGEIEERGLRIKGHDYYRGGMGAHDNGSAIDLIPYKEGYTPVELIKEFHNKATEPFISTLLFDRGIRRIETINLASTWIHLDCIFDAIQYRRKEIVFIDKNDRYYPQTYKEDFAKYLK